VNKTVFTVLKKERIEQALEIINKVTGGLNGPGNGIAFTIPVNRVIGGSFQQK